MIHIALMSGKVSVWFVGLLFANMAFLFAVSESDENPKCKYLQGLLCSLYKTYFNNVNTYLYSSSKR